MLIKIYQKFVSPLTINRCRFYPTCSEYFIQSLIHKGVMKGVLAGILRIFKCHPFHPGGYDPVSVKKNSLNDCFLASKS